MQSMIKFVLQRFFYTIVLLLNNTVLLCRKKNTVLSIQSLKHGQIKIVYVQQ